LSPGVTLLGALPVGIIVRDHSVVAALSMLSVGCVLLFAVVILVLAVLHAATAAPAAAMTAAVVSTMQTWNPDGLLIAFPVMAYGFTAHPYYLGIYQMLATPNIKRMNKVTDAVSVGVLSAKGFDVCSRGCKAGEAVCLHLQHARSDCRVSAGSSVHSWCQQ
jgi:sodium-coupled neutral amino acid transporter 10